MGKVKRAKQTFKNVIKNLVKENQRIHDYDSKYGVKFWNKILKDSKFYVKNHKVFDENVHKVVERDYAYYLRELEKEDLTAEKRQEFNEKIYQLSFFINGEWKNMIDANARLYPQYRNILYLIRENKAEYREKKIRFN